MKQDTKDWLKRTAGTSALVASPGVIAATAIGGPLAGLAVGGAVAAGNVVGSLAYKKYKDVKEDIENRKKFRELQKHVLAQNGILYYQPMVPAPMVGVAGDMSLSRSQKKEIRDYANSKVMDIAKSRIDTLANSIRTDSDKISKLTSKPFFKEMNMSCGDTSEKYSIADVYDDVGKELDKRLLGITKANTEHRVRERKIRNYIDEQKLLKSNNITAREVFGKDMSCLGKILHKDFTINQVLGNALYRTKVGQAIDKGITLADNLGEGIITRNGNTVRSDFKKLTGFSEDSLLAVDEEELKQMRDDIEFTSDPSEKELKKSRYLSMLNEVSRDRLEELLDEGKPKEECVTCNPPVSMFSESPNLQNIAKGGDFGILSVLSAGAKHLFKGAKVAGNIAKNTNAIKAATDNAIHAAEVAKTASETGGWLGKIARGAGKTAARVKEGFTGKVAENVAEGAQKAAEAGADVAKKATEGAGKLIDEGKKVADEVTKVETKLSKIDPSSMNKYELKGVKMAGNSKVAAALGEKIGYENLGRGMKALDAGATAQTAEAIQKERAKQQQTA